MIYGHKIVNINNEDVLYLYLDFSYEFSNEFNKNNGIFSNIKKYLKSMKEKFNGKKIVIMVSGIAIATLSLNLNPVNTIKQNDDTLYVSSVYFNEKIDTDTEEKTNEIANSEQINQIEENNEISSIELINENKENTNNHTQNNQVINNQTQNSTKIENSNTPIKQVEDTANNTHIDDTTQNKTIVTIYRSNGNILNIEIEEYLIGVVAAEMPASFNIEALKAQAIVARTYTLKAINQNRKLTDTVSTQVYNDNNQLHAKWDPEYQKYYDKVKKAVDDTKGLYISYNGTYIEAVYHAISNGYTEDATEVWGNSFPYLKSVSSIQDKNVKNYEVSTFKTYEEISSVLNTVVDVNTEININNYTQSGRVKEIQIGNLKLSGTEFRAKLNLRSADISIEKQEMGINIITKGYGHGVGMSQYGANEIAKEGYTYNQIINHYYPNTIIKK